MLRRIATFVLPLLLALLAAPCASLHAAPSPVEPDATGASIRLTVDLTDGSRLHGTPDLPEGRLALDGLLGRIAVPLVELESIDVAEDRETTVLKFANGDRLTGFPAEKGLPLRTVLGPLVVPWAAVSRCTVNVVRPAAGEEPLRPVSVRASGWWKESQRPEMAFDGDPATSWSSGDWKGWIEADFGSVRDLAALRATLQFHPPGNATHELYVSTTPIGTNRQTARLLRTLSGPRHNHDLLAIDCPAGTQARYVQIHSPSSRSWFNIFEIETVPRVMADRDRAIQYPVRRVRR